MPLPEAETVSSARSAETVVTLTWGSSGSNRPSGVWMWKRTNHVPFAADGAGAAALACGPRLSSVSLGAGMDADGESAATFADPSSSSESSPGATSATPTERSPEGRVALTKYVPAGTSISSLHSVAATSWRLVPSMTLIGWRSHGSGLWTCTLRRPVGAGGALTAALR